MNLGKLTEIRDLRTIWAHEASDFTPWLADDDNISLLGDAIGMEIMVEDRESPVGDFNVDILASEIGTGRTIIIENQLGDTDHDHLGKLITYASGKTANVVVWVVKRAREEHRAAIEWLNNHTDDQIGFFLCEIKLYKIGDSDPAVKFEVIERPNDWAKEIKKNSTASNRSQQRLEYWIAFQDYAFQNNNFAKAFRRPKPSGDHWMDFSIGSSACHIGVDQIRKRNELVVELYISESKELFHALFQNKSAIENAVGFALDWRELPERKASRILATRPVTFDDRENWEEQFAWVVDTMMRFKHEFKKYI